MRSKEERVAKMNALGIPFYYGGAPCQAAGHTLRTKPGHCIQCDTAKIRFQLRNSASGYVYLAYSNSQGYAKVGYSEWDPDERAESLRRESYGTASDWRIIKWVLLEKGAGKIEFAIHANLEEYRKPVMYEKSRGVQVECREIFACSQQAAIAAFIKEVPPNFVRADI